jgi:hypothetical protein
MRLLHQSKVLRFDVRTYGCVKMPCTWVTMASEEWHGRALDACIGNTRHRRVGQMLPFLTPPFNLDERISTHPPKEFLWATNYFISSNFEFCLNIVYSLYKRKDTHPLDKRVVQQLE